MGRLKLTRRLDEHGNSFAVLSKGAASFSVRVVEGERNGPVTANEADSAVRHVTRTSLAEALNRPQEEVGRNVHRR